MLYHLLLNYPKHRFIVSDLNSDLVLSYITIRDRADELIYSFKKINLEVFSICPFGSLALTE